MIIRIFRARVQPGTNAQLALLIISAILPLVLCGIMLKGAQSTSQAHAQAFPQNDVVIFLPVIVAPPSPAGSYHCLEYEFGLIWTSEVITLNVDGTSIYDYDPPYAGTVTGTWAYSPTIQEVSFTNFRWVTSTYEIPNLLWARRYLPNAGFEIAIYCSRP